MNPSSAETRQLVLRAIGGDRLAIEELLAQFRPQLRQMVAVRMDSRLKARFDPSDVVQSVLAEAAQKMVAFQKDSRGLAGHHRLDGRAESAEQNVPVPFAADHFYPWLRQLAWDELARLHRDHIRTKKRSVSREEDDWRGRAADESMLQLADRLAAQQLGPGSRLVHKELRTRVSAALTQLAPQDREVLVLRFLEQLGISDTAAALGITEAAVKSRQFRAVERLGKLLHDLRSDSQSTEN
jgi:RNA polymerase sigma factor (sigma-70 family)